MQLENDREVQKYHNNFSTCPNGRRRRNKSQFYNFFRGNLTENSDVRFSNNNGRLQRKDRERSDERKRQESTQYTTSVTKPGNYYDGLLSEMD